jgi:class 3 adenylate cyclase
LTADIAAISLGMPASPTRKLVAILASDIAGYSALMGADEPGTVRDLKAHQAVVLPMIGEFRGRIIDTAGDGILAEFASVADAVECAIAVQTKMAERNTSVPLARRMQFRMGINLGDVIYDGERLYGEGINIAARLEAIADPGGICISDKVYIETAERLGLACDDLGLPPLKNIVRPVRVYRVRLLGKAQPVSGSTLVTRTVAVPPAKLPPLHAFAAYAGTLVVLLLLGHYVIVVKFDLYTGFLRAFSLALPALVGYVFSRSSGTGVGWALMLGATAGVLSVLGMHVVIGFVDSTSIVPVSLRDWQEAMEYALGITFAAVGGSLVALGINAAAWRIGGH